MPCEIIDDEEGRTFLCWSAIPKDKKVRCAVCKKRWGTLLCDGVLDGPPVLVAVTDGDFPGTYEQRERRTCDAPLCEGCTTRPEAPVIALPDDSSLGLSVLKGKRRQNARRDLGQKRKSLLPEPDTRDFCPACVARMKGVR